MTASEASARHKINDARRNTLLIIDCTIALIFIAVCLHKELVDPVSSEVYPTVRG